MKLEFSEQILEKKKSWCIKFNRNPSSGSRVVSCGRMDRRTDMTKVIVAFHNFANAPKSDSCGIAYHFYLSVKEVQLYAVIGACRVFYLKT